MGSGTLTVDLSAIAANWRALDRMSAPKVETGAVVKANAYGLGADKVARTLLDCGCRRFFVANAAEGASLRGAIGPGPEIFMFSGHMPGDTDVIGDMVLTPLINSADQMTRQLELLPGRAFGIQLDTGMSRLGMAPNEWLALRDILLPAEPALVLSHLACADTPDHPKNAEQLALFTALTEGTGLPRSLAATGGIQLGPAYHFDLTRPGIGLYGCEPFAAGQPALTLSLPVMQTRLVEPGVTAGYAASWQAARPSRLATVFAGYADGLPRSLAGQLNLYHGDQACPVVGRVSMDALIVDITDLAEAPDSLDVIAPAQPVDALAAAAGTIGYEILTSLGRRHQRRYRGGA